MASSRQHWPVDVSFTPICIIIDAHLSVDELQITGALSIAVSGTYEFRISTCILLLSGPMSKANISGHLLRSGKLRGKHSHWRLTILGSGLVVGILAHTTIFVHGHKVESTIETARELGEVDIECEFLVQQAEHLVRGIRLHKIQARTDIGRVGSFGDELEGQRAATSCSAICCSIISTLKGTIGSASFVIRAECRTPGVSVIAIGVASTLLIVDPSPVGIDDDLSGFRSTASLGGTCLPGHARVGFCL